MTLVEVDLHDLEEKSRGTIDNAVKYFHSNPRYKYKILHIHMYTLYSFSLQKMRTDLN